MSPVRLIDENNEQIGVVDIEEARRRAQQAGLDLVEVSSASTPPVCRVMDYGKWKYQQKKKEQKTRSHSKQSELKEVRLRPKIDTHDLTIKIDRARQFLTEGNKVQFTMQFRGREMAHRDLGYKTLQQISEQLSSLSKVEIMPRMAAGRRMTMMLVPDRGSKPGGKKTAAKPSSSSNPSGDQTTANDGKTPATPPQPQVATTPSPEPAAG